MANDYSLDPFETEEASLNEMLKAAVAARLRSSQGSSLWGADAFDRASSMGVEGYVRNKKQDLANRAQQQLESDISDYPDDVKKLMRNPSTRAEGAKVLSKMAEEKMYARMDAEADDRDKAQYEIGGGSMGGNDLQAGYVQAYNKALRQANSRNPAEAARGKVNLEALKRHDPKDTQATYRGQSVTLPNAEEAYDTQKSTEAKYRDEVMDVATGDGEKTIQMPRQKWLELTRTGKLQEYIEAQKGGTALNSSVAAVRSGTSPTPSPNVAGPKQAPSGPSVLPSATGAAGRVAPPPVGDQFTAGPGGMKVDPGVQKQRDAYRLQVLGDELKQELPRAQQGDPQAQRNVAALQKEIQYTIKKMGLPADQLAVKAHADQGQPGTPPGVPPQQPSALSGAVGAAYPQEMQRMMAEAQSEGQQAPPPEPQAAPLHPEAAPQGQPVGQPQLPPPEAYLNPQMQLRPPQNAPGIKDPGGMKMHVTQIEAEKAAARKKFEDSKIGEFAEKFRYMAQNSSKPTYYGTTGKGQMMWDEVWGGAKSLAGDANPHTDERYQNTKEFQMFLADVVQNKAKLLGTNPSDADVRFLTEGLPALANDPNSRAYLTRRLSEMADRQVQKQAKIAEMVGQNYRLVDAEAAYDQWDKARVKQENAEYNRMTPQEKRRYAMTGEKPPPPGAPPPNPTPPGSPPGGALPGAVQASAPDYQDGNDARMAAMAARNSAPPPGKPFPPKADDTDINLALDPGGGPLGFAEDMWNKVKEFPGAMAEHGAQAANDTAANLSNTLESMSPWGMTREEAVAKSEEGNARAAADPGAFQARSTTDAFMNPMTYASLGARTILQLAAAGGATEFLKPYTSLVDQLEGSGKGMLVSAFFGSLMKAVTPSAGSSVPGLEKATKDFPGLKATPAQVEPGTIQAFLLRSLGINDAATARQVTQLSEGLAAKAGIKGPIKQDTIDEAKLRLTTEIENSIPRTQVRLGTDKQNEMRQAFDTVLGGNSPATAQTMAANELLIGAQGGTQGSTTPALTRIYQSLSSTKPRLFDPMDLHRAVAELGQSSHDPVVVRQVQDVLEKAITMTFSPKQAAAYKELNLQLANLDDIERIFNASKGESAGNLAGTLKPSSISESDLKFKGTAIPEARNAIKALDLQNRNPGFSKANLAAIPSVIAGHTSGYGLDMINRFMPQIAKTQTGKNMVNALRRGAALSGIDAWNSVKDNNATER